MSTIRVYICGHAKADDEAVWENGAWNYVFERTSCTLFCSTRTRFNPFGCMPTVPDAAEINLKSIIDAAVVKMERIHVKRQLERARRLNLSHNEIRALACDDVFELIVSDSKLREDWAKERLFGFEAINTMSNLCIEFGSDASKRGYFDVCAGQFLHLCSYARMSFYLLRRTIDEMCKRRVWLDSTPDRRNPDSYFRDWPYLRGEYEPNFGVEELEILRNAGAAGEDILAQPWTGPNLCRAGAIIDILREGYPFSLIATIDDVDTETSLTAWTDEFAKHAQAYRDSLTHGNARLGESWI